MRKPAMTPRNRYLLTRWLDEKGFTGTRSETAREAMEALKFTVTADDISAASLALGISTKSDIKHTTLIAQDLVSLRKELGLKVSEELQRIAHKQAP